MSSALQEMGPEPYLDELQNDLRAEGLDYPYSALVEAEDRRRHVALLSRLPLKAVRRHTDLEFPYLGGRERVKRGLLEAVVETSAGDLTIFVVHLKSRLTDRPDDPEGGIRRLAEAGAVRDCIRRVSRSRRGRAFRPDRGLQRRAEQSGACAAGAPGRAVIAVLLPAADSRGETWTEYYSRGDRYSDLDHILVSPGLRAARGGRRRRTSTTDRRRRHRRATTGRSASPARAYFPETVIGTVTSPPP